MSDAMSWGGETALVWLLKKIPIYWFIVGSNSPHIYYFILPQSNKIIVLLAVF